MSAVILTGPGIDWTGAVDSTAAVQAKINAAPAGAGIVGQVGVLKFSALTLDKGKRLDCPGGQSFRDAATTFGDAAYMADANFGGCVLRSTATTGTAITVLDNTGSSDGHLSGFVLIGPGSGTSVGIALGGSSATVLRPTFRDVRVCNFATGSTFRNVNEGSFYDFALRGCTKALNLFENTNNNAFYGLNLQRVTDG